MKKYIVFLPNKTATIIFGASLAKVCQKDCIIYLYGEFGTGKTTFCRSFIRALGYQGNVKSPTFTLVETYTLPHWTIYHFDLYRLVDPEELEFIGIRDFFNNKALYLVEWPQHGKDIFPTADIILTLVYKNGGRQLQAEATSATGKYIMARMKLC